MCPFLHLGFFILFFSGVSEYYEGSFLSEEIICDFSLFSPILYKPDPMPVQNNMLNLWEIILESYGLPCNADISVLPLFYPVVTIN